MEGYKIVLIGYLLDLVFGDPRWLLHPVVVIGKLITILEKVLYPLKKFGGLILWFLVVGTTVLLTYGLGLLSIVVQIYLIFTIFATRSLEREGRKVYKILKTGDLDLAKRELSYLVSRDTENMDQRDIIRSTMETISENIVDGITSPMFFIVLGYLIAPNTPLGVALGMGYKAINTLDSMVGYKNKKYLSYGYFPAKIDDIANFIPARITGLIFIPLGTLFTRDSFKGSLKIFFRDRKNHGSPNSGHSEAAIAGALGVQFGGRTTYFNEVLDKPTIGDRKKEFQLEDIIKNIKLMEISGGIAMVISCIIMLLS